MPKSRIFWYQNFLLGNQSYIGQVAKAVGPKGLVMAGPDVLPDKQDLEYRFVGKHLLLLDSRAHFVVDYVPNAIP